MFGPDAILLVGNLKVGKSTIFAWYTGRKRRILNIECGGRDLMGGPIKTKDSKTIIDAPGINSLLERSEEADSIRYMLSAGKVGAICLVLDAKNLKKGLSLALELALFKLPMVVALNMIDEARLRGINVDVEQLISLLGVPVVRVVAHEGRGLGQLKTAFSSARIAKLALQIPDKIQKTMTLLEQQLAGECLSPKGLAYLLTAGYRSVEKGNRSGKNRSLAQGTDCLIKDHTINRTEVTEAVLIEAAQTQSSELSEKLTGLKLVRQNRWTEQVAVWTRRPLTGVPIAIAVIAMVYLFVGWFGAGVLVDLLENRLFSKIIMPVITLWVEHIPWEWVRSLLIGPFGLISVGISLSLTVVLPVLATFFFAFALLEDSGYLSRLSLLTDRLLRHIGLNGKGVLPLIMGFSCITMAIITTRTLGSTKQRTIASLLLILAVPCAPMLGVVLVILSHLSLLASLVYFGVLLVQFLLIGYLANRIIPGQRPDLIIEIPPFRVPTLKNSLIKSGYQLIWFLKEAIPHFLLGTLVLFLLDQAGMLDALRAWFKPVSEKLLGLPGESADIFMMTIVRREAGVAMLSQQFTNGLYNGAQTIVILVVMTLMAPCINSVLVLFKERGILVSISMLLFVTIYAVLVGSLVNVACGGLGVVF